MKTTLLLFLLSVSFFSQAQSWCPPGAKWYYINGNVGSTGADYLVYEKDTVINSQSCQKISALTTKYGPVAREGNIFTFSSNDTVFFHYDGDFWPVYYFNASVGDTLSIYVGVNEFTACDTFMKMVVDSTGIMVANGDSLRYYRATQTPRPAFPNGYEQIEVAEKFGALKKYLLPAFYCTGLVDHFIYYLNCYEDSSFSRIQLFPSTSCTKLYYTGINDLSNQIALSLHPNPSNTHVTVAMQGHTIAQYQVLDYSGKEILSHRADSDALNIDVSTLPQGIYLLKLELTSGQYTVRRFIKQ